MTITAIGTDGRPVPGVEFALNSLVKPGKLGTANPLGLGIASAVTDEAGVAKITWMARAGGGNIPLSGRGYAALDDVTVRSSVPGDVAETIQVVRDGRLSGRVVVPDGSPARGVRVRAEGRGRTAQYCRRWTRTGEDGTYSVEVSGDGSYQVAVIEADYAADPYRGIIVREGESRGGLDFRLKAGTRLHGRVRLPADAEPERPPTVTVVLQGPPLPDEFQPTPGANVRWNLVTWVRPDAEGRYEVRLGRGEYTVTGTLARDPQTIRVDGTGELALDLTGPEAAPMDLEGAVVDASGARWPGRSSARSSRARTRRSARRRWPTPGAGSSASVAATRGHST